MDRWIDIFNKFYLVLFIQLHFLLVPSFFFFFSPGGCI